MTEDTELDDPISFLETKVSQEEWTIEIVEGFGGKAISIDAVGNQTSIKETKHEARVRDDFQQKYGPLVLDLDDHNDEYRSGSLDWYIQIGKRIAESDIIEERTKKEFRKIMREIDDDFTRDKLRWAETIYEYFPSKSEMPDIAEGESWFCRLCVKADSREEIETALSNIDESVGQRVVSVWSNVDDDPKLEDIAEEVVSLVQKEHGFSAEKQVKSVKKVCKMHNRPIPSSEEIEEILDAKRD